MEKEVERFWGRDTSQATIRRAEAILAHNAAIADVLLDAARKIHEIGKPEIFTGNSYDWEDIAAIFKDTAPWLGSDALNAIILQLEEQEENGNV